MTEPSILQENHNSVAVLVINRPQVRNALDIATMRTLGETIRQLEHDEGARVIVITGAGDIAFSAGGDIAEMTTFSPLKADALMQEWQDTFERIERSSKPVIAAVNGYAYGGGTELAMACHIRVASEDAKFGQPEIALDHIPGAGGTQRLPRLVPLGIAYEHLLTGEPIAAAHAHRIGLVNYVWPKADLLPNTLALASRIAERGPVAVRYTLEAIRAGLSAPLPVGLRLERALAGLVLESAEARAGLDAFLRKRGRAGSKQT
jgi:enoyl-CoA hydratase